MGDVAQYVEQHLVRTLINVALVMYHHVVTSSLAVLHIQGTDPTCSGERSKIADLAVHSQVHTYYEKELTVINGNCNNDLKCLVVHALKLYLTSAIIYTQ